MDAIGSVFRAYDTWLSGSSDFAPEHLLEDWTDERFDPRRDSWLVRTPDGTAVAFGYVVVESASAQDAFGIVDPSHHGRGVGGFLIDAMEARADERAGDHPVLRFSASADDAPAQDLALGRGFRLVRRFVHMERSLTDLPEAPVPDGVTIAVYERGRDDHALFDAKEAAFAGHFGHEPDDFERWLRRLESMETFSPDGVFIAWQGDGALGLVDTFRAGDVGWIAELGVRPEARGRGIGSALLVRGFERLASLGLERARLNVDAENETGAVRLYERHGMTVRREWRVYEKALG